MIYSYFPTCSFASCSYYLFLLFVRTVETQVIMKHIEWSLKLTMMTNGLRISIYLSSRRPACQSVYIGREASQLQHHEPHHLPGATRILGRAPWLSSTHSRPKSSFKLHSVSWFDLTFPLLILQDWVPHVLTHHHPATVLSPLAIVNLQLVCKRLLELGRDDTLWREQSFLESSFLEHLPRRREILTHPGRGDDAQIRDLARALADSHGLGDLTQPRPRKEPLDLKTLSNEKVRIRANWDPVFPGEKVNWYDEYIRRHAPISTSWLQQPRNRESPEREFLEVRGVALYSPPGESELTLSVAPLDDGSLCLWDINGAKGRKGAIWQRSKPGILSVDSQSQIGPSRRSKMVSTGVTECIAVDNIKNRAYVAVQSSKTPLQTIGSMPTLFLWWFIPRLLCVSHNCDQVARFVNYCRLF